MPHKIKIRAAIISTLLILLFAGSVFAALPHLLHTSTTYTAYIYQDGELLYTIPLRPDSNQLILIGDREHSYNLVNIQSGSVCIKEASCPDQICVKQGAIHNALVPITCLPNHVVIEVKADSSSEDMPDAITH